MSATVKGHWENIYATKQPHEVSWTQDIPATSLDFLYRAGVSKDSPIIDVGGGESKFVDFLLRDGYTDITVLDISEHALKHTQTRLADQAKKIKWIASDVLDFQPDRKYQLWHDRATFHFLTGEGDIDQYVSLAARHIMPDGFMMVGTFSEKGPTKCSGLPVKRYSESLLTNVLANHFKKIGCITEDHETPFHTIQNFLFCSFKKIR